jgi:hypothetical protein
VKNTVPYNYYQKIKLIQSDRKLSAVESFPRLMDADSLQEAIRLPWTVQIHSGRSETTQLLLVAVTPNVCLTDCLQQHEGRDFSISLDIP